MENLLHKNIIITGHTGSGKTYFLNKIIKTLIEENSPTDLGLILIDPKRVEFSMHEGMPHMLLKVAYSPEEAKDAFKWIWKESLIRLRKTEKTNQENKNAINRLSEIVIIIDEFADLICYDKKFFEEYVEKISAFSDATKIYLILSTSRPSPNDVYTQKIKDCFMTRICFYCDINCSLFVLGERGAETLLRQRNYLIKDMINSKIKNCHSPFIDEKTILETIAQINEKYKQCN